ncbi:MULTISPECIES: hypothetical protein [Microbacteriaceae]|uniref:Uncharacterized protein n=2 Tax=Microbacteriaceae TaxID=85023 RepID=A0ABV3LHY2_9MICO|nr:MULTISPECIES: hypothetical protein [Microbacteriaceae]MCE7480884.1 hypothetical protein [Microbacterium profundi]
MQPWAHVDAVPHCMPRAARAEAGELLPYDVAWNAAGGLLLLAGVAWTIALARRGHRAASAPPAGADAVTASDRGR